MELLHIVYVSRPAGFFSWSPFKFLIPEVAGYPNDTTIFDEMQFLQVLFSNTK